VWIIQSTCGGAENQKGGGLGGEREAVILWFRRGRKDLIAFMQIQVSFVLVS
jgi:hypothetical protein